MHSNNAQGKISAAIYDEIKITKAETHFGGNDAANGSRKIGVGRGRFGKESKKRGLSHISNCIVPPSSAWFLYRFFGARVGFCIELYTRFTVAPLRPVLCHRSSTRTHLNLSRNPQPLFTSQAGICQSEFGHRAKKTEERETINCVQ